MSVEGPNQSRYSLQISASASHALAETLPTKIALAAYEFITGVLLDNPQRVGKPLSPPLAPAYSARRGDYRILYVIDDQQNVVFVTAIGHRSIAYRTK
jgi:mRNA interferase RelE/StbE